MHKTLDAIENIWLENGEKKYLCGDKISVADIVACCELEQPLMAGLVYKYLDLQGGPYVSERFCEAV